jgi:hypothetical protein
MLWRQAREQRARGVFALAYGKLHVAVANCGPDLARADRADFYLELSELALAQRSRRMCRDNLQAAKSQLKGAARTPEREKRASELGRVLGQRVNCASSGFPAASSSVVAVLDGPTGPPAGAPKVRPRSRKARTGSF